jgi:type IV pilus assembly protein PilA
MVQKLRERTRGEGGFTLVELLVVMLILGLLAAIAIPSFFNQRDKARDADAKADARTAQTAIETYATDNNGSYADASPEALRDIEATLNDADIAVNSTVSTYEITATSATGNTFTIARNADGETSFDCTEHNQGGCPQGGNWGGSTDGGAGGGDGDGG